MKLLDDPMLSTPPPPAGTPPGPRAALVTLVGAGPGDPELLTVKAATALRRASLVLYDHLVSPAVLALVPEGADRVYVGKESSNHSLSQRTIIELMLRYARAGRPLLRLKGGDGYIFGRGGEEAQALAEAGVPFEVIPGLSAAQGAAASVGIPLTHRDHAATLVFATGHGRDDGDPGLDWAALARPRQTLVVYMGIGTLARSCEQLIAHGLPADTPAAIVERATLPGERCLTGTLGSLPSLACTEQVRPPALVIVGQVVSLQPLLARAAARHGPP
jgi:uroporphyrin-III C-methyltransferase